MGFSRQEHWSGLPFPSPMHESEKWMWSCSVVSDSSRPHGLKPTRLLLPWDFPGKSTGVGCHCIHHLCYLAGGITDTASVFSHFCSNLLSGNENKKQENLSISLVSILVYIDSFKTAFISFAEYCIRRTHFLWILINGLYGGFPGSSVVKNLPANAGNARDTGWEDPRNKKLGCRVRHHWVTEYILMTWENWNWIILSILKSLFCNFDHGGMVWATYILLAISLSSEKLCSNYSKTWGMEEGRREKIIRRKKMKVKKKIN